MRLHRHSSLHGTHRTLAALLSLAGVVVTARAAFQAGLL
jgi:hypothetical protein